MKMNLWLTGILLKVGTEENFGVQNLQATPCFLLFGLTLALIARLRENRAKRKALLKAKEDPKVLSRRSPPQTNYPKMKYHIQPL